MKLSEIREHLHKAPFRPLVFRLADGRKHRVDHPDYLYLPPVGETFVIVVPKGGVQFIEANQVEEIKVAKGRRKAA